MMTDLARETITVDGASVTFLTGGSGEPLVFFHGAGTFHGFEFARPWTENYRVIIPFHPGFGESADDDRIADMHDYVMHYMELFDRLELEQVNLVGFSLGGWRQRDSARSSAIEYGGWFLLLRRDCVTRRIPPSTSSSSSLMKSWSDSLTTSRSCARIFPRGMTSTSLSIDTGK